MQTKWYLYYCGSSSEVAYFNSNTKDVIPGVSQQILQVKASE